MMLMNTASNMPANVPVIIQTTGSSESAISYLLLLSMFIFNSSHFQNFIDKLGTLRMFYI